MLSIIPVENHVRVITIAKEGEDGKEETEEGHQHHVCTGHPFFHPSLLNNKSSASAQKQKYLCGRLTNPALYTRDPAEVPPPVHQTDRSTGCETCSSLWAGTAPSAIVLEKKMTWMVTHICESPSFQSRTSSILSEQNKKYEFAPPPKVAQLRAT